VVGKVAGHYAAPYMSSNVVANASIIGMIGGIASEASGGDFYEGAMQAAFVYLFNDVWADSIAERRALGNREDSKLFKKVAKRLDKDMLEPMRKIKKGTVKIYNGLSRDIPASYNNAPKWVQITTIDVALTIIELGPSSVIKAYSNLGDVGYSLYSGHEFITWPTNRYGWLGWMSSKVGF